MITTHLRHFIAGPWDGETSERTGTVLFVYRCDRDAGQYELRSTVSIQFEIAEEQGRLPELAYLWTPDGSDD